MKEYRKLCRIIYRSFNFIKAERREKGAISAHVCDFRNVGAYREHTSELPEFVARRIDNDAVIDTRYPHAPRQGLN